MNGGKCTDGVNSYICTCAAGYIGDNCQTSECQIAGQINLRKSPMIWKDYFKLSEIAS